MIGDEIKRVRKLKKLTQDQLGELVGITGVAIMRYEKGQREPNKETIQKIADALDTTPVQLMGWDEKYNPDGKLEQEVEVVEKIENFYGKGSAELVHFYSILDDQGKEKAYDYVYYLAEQHQKNKEKKTPGAANTKDQL